MTQYTVGIRRSQWWWGGGGREGGGWWFAAFQASEERERALSIKVKNPEISVGTKMDFSNSDM